MQVLLAMATGLDMVFMIRPSSGLLTFRCSWPWPQGLHGSSFIRTADGKMQVA